MDNHRFYAIIGLIAFLAVMYLAGYSDMQTRLATTETHRLLAKCGGAL